MHYTIEFKGTRQQMEQQALDATREYLGDKHYNRILAMAADARTWRGVVQVARLGCMLSGVQGYWPVHAITRQALHLRYPNRKR